MAEFKTLLAKFIEKHAPKTEWESIEEKTRYNDKVIEKNEKVAPSGHFVQGFSLIKHKGGFLFVTRTVEDSSEKLNSVSFFDADSKFKVGIVNCFASPFGPTFPLSKIKSSKKFAPLFQAMTEEDKACNDQFMVDDDGEYVIEQFEGYLEYQRKNGKEEEKEEERSQSPSKKMKIEEKEVINQ